jgi:threonine dehydrogenase-like Zn-dependent dehydrogenase
LKRGIASHTDILLRVYGGLLDKVPFGAAFGKGITMKMGQTNMNNYMKPLLERIEKGQIDPSYIISHRITLNEAPEMYKIMRGAVADAK